MRSRSAMGRAYSAGVPGRKLAPRSSTPSDGPSASSLPPGADRHPSGKRCSYRLARSMATKGVHHTRRCRTGDAGQPACRHAVVAIDGPGFAGNVAVANQCAQVFGGSLSGGPSIGARLVRLRRVDSPKVIGHAIDLERIAVNHAGRLSEGGRGNEREGRGQDRQFHRLWLARDCGDTAAATSAGVGVHAHHCMPPWERRALKRAER